MHGRPGGVPAGEELRPQRRAEPIELGLLAEARLRLREREAAEGRERRRREVGGAAGAVGDRGFRVQLFAASDRARRALERLKPGRAPTQRAIAPVRGRLRAFFDRRLYDGARGAARADAPRGLVR